VWKEIEQLRRATVTELRAKYLELFGQASRSNHKQFLFRRVAWRLQAQAYGELFRSVCASMNSFERLVASMASLAFLICDA
jgi:hypothetical protein